ncbi:MAG: 2-hydroxyacid dehydrogenase [Thermoleophilia bacterium]
MAGEKKPGVGATGSRSPDPRIVFLTRAIPEPGPTLLRSRFVVRGGEKDRDIGRDELMSGAAGAHALLCTLREHIDAEVLDAAGPSLRVVSNLAVGYDNIDVSAATARGVLVTNTPGVLTEATADLAWTLLLAAARRVPEGDRLVRAGGFTGWSPTMLLGHDVAGRTLGIVGMGHIGRAVARRSIGFDMRVLYTRRSGPLAREELPIGVTPGAGGADRPGPAGTVDGGASRTVAWEYRSRLDDLLREADMVSLHVPLSSETRHLLGARELSLLKPGAILVNTARGPVIDESALVEALRSGRLGAAGLDVYEDEPAVHPGLVTLDNTVLLPHLGSATLETRGRMAELAAQNVMAALCGDPVPHPVNARALGGVKDGSCPEQSLGTDSGKPPDEAG